ncbi:MAG: response regulator [Candidatus Binatia bacterium]
MQPHVLVVDDEESVRELIARMLETEGYRTTQAASALAALAAAGRDVPELILADVMMPDLDGYELLERLRADPRLASVPVIFISALGDETNVERGRRLGVDHYLTKPVSTRQVLALVSGTLRRYAELRRAHLVRSPVTAVAAAPVGVVPTGIGPIDDQVGGLCPGRVHLTIGDVGTGKSVLAVQFLHGALVGGEGAVMVTTERCESVLYVATSAGIDLRPSIRTGRLVLLGLADRWEALLETHDDVRALAAEIAAYAREVAATRVVVSSVLALLCSTPRLALSAPIMTDLVAGLETTGATTLLVSDVPVTEQEELATTYLERTTFGTLRLEKPSIPATLGVLRFTRFQGLGVLPEGRPFCFRFGAGLASADPQARDGAWDARAELGRLASAAVAEATVDGPGLAPRSGGGWRMRDPFAAFVHDCVVVAAQASERLVCLVGRFELRHKARGDEGAALAVADLEGVLGADEVLCWLRGGEIVVIALGAAAAQASALATRIAERLAAIAARRGAELVGVHLACVALPDNATTPDAVVEAVGRDLALVPIAGGCGAQMDRVSS